MKKTLVGFASLALCLVAAPAFAFFKLEITEIWSGNFAAPDATADWFEVTNVGNTAFTGTLYYEDEAPTGTQAVPLTLPAGGILPNETVIFIDGNASAVTTFQTFWGAAVPGGQRFGTFSNNSSALSNAGDQVNLWINPTLPINPATTPANLTANLPSTVGFRGASFDSRLRVFSVAGNAAGAVTLASPIPPNADPTTASPGRVQSNTSGAGGIDLQITEIWPGNVVSPDSTEDWFEITNMGETAWTPAAGRLFYDDSSADPGTSTAAAVELLGITEILPHETVIFIEIADTGVQEFKDFWQPRVGLTLKVGTFQGSGLSLSGTNGDSVNVWRTPNFPVPTDTRLHAEYAAGSNGSSFDVQRAIFSQANTPGAVQVLRGGQPPEPTTASPGRLAPVPVPFPGLWLAPAIAGVAALRLRRRQA
jgi:hypothetical protein